MPKEIQNIRSSAILRKSCPFLLILIVSVLFCAALFYNVILPADTFHWDESHHALYSVWLTKDIQAGNWNAFWQHTHHQALWPFLHSWFVAAFFLLFGISYATARAANLFLFLLVLLGIWLVGKELNKERGLWIGLAGWGLAITSKLIGVLPSSLRYVFRMTSSREVVAIPRSS